MAKIVRSQDGSFAITFGRKEGGRFFPSNLVFVWRDDIGINPSLSWTIFQFGRRDRHLMPKMLRVVRDRIGRAPRWVEES